MDKTKMDFAVVEFTADSSVEVVPSLWLTENSQKSYWPPYKGDRLMKSIKKVEQPTHSWKSYAVRVIHEYESYGDARLKLRQAEETSALDTETDEVATMKSREKRKKILTDEDDDEAIQPEGVVPLKKVKKTSPDSFQATTLPVVPTSLQCQPVVGNTDLTTQNFDQCDQSNELTQNDNDIESAQLDVEPSETAAVSQSGTRKSPRLKVRLGETLSSALSSKSSLSRSTLFSGKRLDFDETPGHDNCRQSNNGSATRASPRDSRRQSNNGSATRASPRDSRRQSNNGSATRASPDGTLKDIKARLAIIEAHQRQHTVLLQHVLSALQKHDADEDCDAPVGVNLPLNSLKDLRNLEATLEDNEKAKQLTRHLGSVGGRDVPDTTRRTMRTLMTNALAVRMNFEGRGDKVGISDSKVMKVIIRAVKRNRLCSKATRDDIETTVKLWLRYAKDRAGGRSCRLTSKKRNRPVVAGESGDSASE
jgi:hypothetical protein